MASSTIRFSTDASRDITGLAGGADGRIAILCNVGSFPAVLKDESASSTAGNRFDLGEDITIPAQGSAVLRYDATLSRWQCIGCWIGSPGGGITQLTGDVTAGPGSGSQAATIANSAVTLAKIANIADQTILGNNTGGAAAPVALTATQVRTILGGGILVADGDKGDITVSSSGTAWTIDNGVVTYAKIQDVSATDKLLGRSTAGAGVVEEIACTAFGRSLIDDAAASNARTTLGATTVGGNYFTLTNPSAITFPRMNADNTVTALNAADFRTAIGAGSGSGTVTSVASADASVTVTSGTTTPDLAVNPSWITSAALINGYFTNTVSGGALTIAIKNQAGSDPSASGPVKCLFRDSTNYDYDVLTLTAATSLVISSGSTLGATSTIPFRIWVVAFNDGGTFRLGAINCYSSSGPTILRVHDDVSHSSTAEGGAGGADNPLTFYTGTAVTGKPLRVLGYIEWGGGLATAGTWNAAGVAVQAQRGMPFPGDAIQTIWNTSGAVATGTTTVPFDDTIPQNTEGDQYFSTAITANSPCNLARIRSRLNFCNSTLAWQITSIFQDSTANALKTGYTLNVSTNYGMQVLVEHLMLFATGSTTTFKLRSGAHTASTTTLNGQAGGRLFGGVSDSFLCVEEIMG